MSNNWCRLLWHWTDREFRHSLTFPFFIGALRNPVGSSHAANLKPRDELESLISDISGFESDEFILHIYRCPTLHQLVLHRVAGTAPPPGALPIRRSDGSLSKVFASDVPGLTEPPDVCTISAAIWSETEDAILKGHFSCNGGIYSPFSPYDLGVISRAFT